MQVIAMSRSLEGLEDFVRQRVEVDRVSQRQLSEELKTCFPESKGFSLRSIERFCAEKNIHKTSRLSNTEVEQAVSEAVAKVRSII